VPYKIVMNTANHNSWALSRECALVCHSPRLMSYISPMITNIQVIYCMSAGAIIKLIFKATYGEAQPSNKAVILFKNIVMCTTETLVIASRTSMKRYLLANPRECAQNRDDNESVGDDSSSNNGRMLDSPVADNVYDLVD
jgi:hypothetical protein